MWKSKGSGIWGAGLQVEERKDSNLSRALGIGRELGDLRTLRLRLFNSRRLNGSWKQTGFLMVSGAAERPDDLGRSLTTMAFLGRDRKTSETTRFGWGVGVLSRPGEGVTVLPVPMFRWDPSGPLSFELTLPRLGVNFELNDRWQLGLTGGPRFDRYLLEDGARFNDTQQSIQLTLRRKAMGQSSVEVWAGRMLGRTWELQDLVGSPDQSVEVDGGTFFGFQATLPLDRLFAR